MILRKLFKGDDHSTTCEPPYLYVGFTTNEFAVKHGCKLDTYIGDMGSKSYRPNNDDVEKIIKPMLDNWCVNYFTGKYEVINDWVMIEKESDAMLFKLTWC